ncbi:MAG: Omp28-related outer membrane protein [Flavobacteriaceae bacterium]|nr:Omp28-related outer membrane protein [Flavobacteriaceae bacterium]
MLKKLLFGTCLLLSCSSLLSQTIVSTTPENKKVIIEEFTGIDCVYCPDGHAIANNIANNNPGNVFIINIHQGSFAVPEPGERDFTTQWGDAIAAQTDLQGYPAATVNRHFFPGQSQGNGTAMSRNQWTSASNSILAEASYVNLAVEATMDAPTNTMTIHVEAYYTGSSPQATNKLNVAILQNNTLGPQTGGNMGNNYNHQHRLIDLVTGQWGEDISTTSANDFVDRTYSYNPPGDINGVPVDLNELEVVVFMTETTQEIISGNAAPVVLNALTNANDANVMFVGEIDPNCTGMTEPSVTIRNTGTAAISSLDLSYNVNGGTSEMYTWNGNLASLEATVIDLPAINFTVATVNTLNVSVEADDFNNNNDGTEEFDAAIGTDNEITVTLTTDNWAEEVSFNITDSSGTVVESEGPFQQTVDDNTTFVFTYTLADDCFTFNMVDAYGDGLTTSAGAGVSVIDANGVNIYPFNGNYGFGFSKQFNTDEQLGVDEAALAQIAIYPNPAQERITISNAETAAVEIFNMLGQTISSRSNITSTEEFEVARLPEGTYFIKITLGEAVTTEKLVIANR